LTLLSLGIGLPLLRARLSFERAEAPQDAAPVASAPGGSKAPSLREAEERVEEARAEERRHLDAFVAEGWSQTGAAPEPDPRVQALDRAVWTSKEREIQLQLQTDLFAGESLDRLRDLALEGPSEKTRQLALEALARADDPRAQELLIEICERAPGAGERERIIALLRPVGADDAAARFLFGLLDRGDVTDALKRQAATALAVFGLTRGAGGELPPRWLLERVRDGWKDAVVEAWDRLRN
jgi:hypothetical protein